ncbi:unnamed protein product [Brachionus calyciflorus]|uniref:Uncharacterized protein n=1 Tax=Brachionus calyciflorus TaxID=104777 RepID=A0A813TAP2_9BILA|nr:unnamed protein product [Brachionus calyciflorus]
MKYKISTIIFLLLVFSLIISPSPVAVVQLKNFEGKGQNNIPVCSNSNSHAGGGGGGTGGVGGDGGTKNFLAGGTHIFGTNIILALDQDMMKGFNFEEIMGKKNSHQNDQRSHANSRPNFFNNGNTRFNLKLGKLEKAENEAKKDDQEIVVKHIYFS